MALTELGEKVCESCEEISHAYDILKHRLAPEILALCKPGKEKSAAKQSIEEALQKINEANTIILFIGDKP